VKAQGPLLRRGIATVSSRMPRLVVEALEAGGADVGGLLATFGVERETLREVDARLPASVDLAVWAEAPRLSRDDCFGLHAAERLGAGAFDVLGYTLRMSPTVGGAFERLVRYNRLLHDQSEMRLTVQGEEARLSFQLFPEGTPRHQAEFSLAVFLLFSREATGTDVVPLAVEFGHPEPRDVSEHRRIFRAPLRFGQRRPTLVLPRSVLHRPLLRADPGLLAVLEKQMRELMVRLPGGEGLVEQVRRLLAEELCEGEPTVGRVARELGMSSRTLHRRLREAETSFRDLVDGLREQLAVRYLAEQRLAIAEAAYLLGFSEASAFHRSFKRWKGVTPADYRRALSRSA
jgi:AraC-like DNA-binding protein